MESAPSLALIDGQPAIAYGSSYVHATDAAGATWGDSVSFDSTGNRPSLALVNGEVAVSYHGSGGLMYAPSVILLSTGLGGGTYMPSQTLTSAPAAVSEHATSAVPMVW